MVSLQFYLLYNISGVCRHLKKKRVQDKSWVAAFFVKGICPKTFAFFNYIEEIYEKVQ